MVDDDKDRLGDKLRKKEKGEEDRYFAEREEAALRKLREQRAAVGTSAERMRCPQCSQPLVTVSEHGVKVDECPSGHGMWLDHHDLETIAKREHDSWLGRYFYRLKR